MNEEIMSGFYVGKYNNYEEALHGKGIYFAKDKGIIIANGEVYSNAVKSVSLNTTGDKLVIIQLDGTQKEIAVATTGGSTGTFDSAYNDNSSITTTTVGGISSGISAATLEGKTYNELFDMLLFPTVNPSITDPSASISFKAGIFTNGQILKVGETGPVASDFNVNYNPGSVYIGTKVQGNRGGTQNTSGSYIYAKVNGGTATQTLPSTIALGNTKYYYRAAYNDSKLQPVDNKGNNFKEPLKAGSIDSAAITLYGTYPWYASTVGVTADNPIIEQPLIIWNNTAGEMYTGDAGFTLEASGIIPQVIKIPNISSTNNRYISSMQIYSDALGWKDADINSSWSVSKDLETINGVNYKVYRYIGQNRGATKLRIKF